MTQKIDDNGTEWEGEQVETEAKPLVNEGNGKPIILRTFKFQLPPGVDTPKNEDLIEAHEKSIKTFLWKDELVLVQPLKAAKTKDNTQFIIFATCQAKNGSVILEAPQLIQNILNGQTNK